jgi:T-complex protein 1 subunit theta
MLKEGSKFFAGLEEAVIRNIQACKEFSNTVKTAYGPNGMNKIIINHFDKLFLTSDCGTIVRELEVQHPAAKMIVQASSMQEQEVGDGTCFVVIFAGALLAHAEDLVRMGLKPMEIVKGYDMALKKCLDILPSLVVEELEDEKDLEKVKRALRSSLASKQCGSEDFLAGLVSQACVSIIPDKNTTFNVDNVRVCKILGAGLYKSEVFQGMVFKRGVETTVNKAEKAKVAVYTCAVEPSATETKGTVLIKSAAELKTFSRGEETLLESQIKEIADTGVKVIVAGGKIADMALHYLNKYGIMGVRLMSKFDIRRVARTVGATALPKLVPPTKEETGHCDHVYVDEVGDSSVVVFKQEGDESRVSTIVIRGATDNLMDDIERAIDDAVNNFKILTRDGRLLPGAGAVEVELSSQIAKFGDTCPGLEQYSIKKFAEALEVFPRTLAQNSGLNVTKSIAALVAAHDEGKANFGLNIKYDGDSLTVDAPAEGILDPLVSKLWGLKYAVHAANTVLKVDEIIMSKPAGGPRAPQGPGGDHDDD